ncbi:ABC-type spermidine/putrescine transport system permease subunit II [Pseudomonas lini]|uniref:ABC transporter permease n=1 Tax=Pseudomonas lini TaxID=163011 RepID=UPI0027853E27|nr:ABC transporter permease [Pseudomonas lini]MDQ0122130.1 ABC-type spermidine/putrescine transport system permease subunit II [Pseudomonas lini]
MLRMYLWLYVLFLYAPIVIIGMFSFHSSPSLVFPFDGWSLRWYEQIFASRTFRESLWNSIIVATAASVVTTLLGATVALALIRIKGKMRDVIATICAAPIALPGLFLGIALVSGFAQVGMNRSLLTVTISHVLYALPFFVATLRSRIDYFDSSLEEAARDLGATTWQSFHLVTLPILRPSIVGAAILVFALSFDELIITVFVSGNESTLPMMIWSMMRRTVDPTINAASMVALGLSLIVITIAGAIFWLQRRAAISSRTSDLRVEANDQVDSTTEQRPQSVRPVQSFE